MPLQGGRKLILVDDLPHASGPEQRSRLAVLLSQLAASARSPVVIISTTSSTQAKGDSGGRSASGGAWHGLHRVCTIAYECMRRAGRS
jgi:mRNA-degrading endonuclease toxin of MazEF toxin-antitoxin module